MLGARKTGILHRLINDQILPSIMVWMPLGDWKQWAKERPKWISGLMEDAFWAFVDQKWRDSLNVTAAEPAGWDQGADYRKGVEAARKGEQGRQAARWGPCGHGRAAPSRAPKKCKFAELVGCTGSHPPWLSKAFGDKAPKERDKIITDNKLCPFCLLHSLDEMCFSNNNKTNLSAWSLVAWCSTSSGCMRC
jgi:hypothetical protein